MSFYHSFRNPPATDRLMPFWFWNAEMDAEEVVHQIQEDEYSLPQPSFSSSSSNYYSYASRFKWKFFQQ
jgi:hypothetical protein